MKLFLLRLTALAMVATRPNVYAADDEQSHILRGSGNYKETLVQVESTCADGQRDGQKAVQNMWSGDCDDVWSLEDDAERMKDKKFPANSSNWKKQAYNDCARDGVDAQVERIEKECLEDDSSQCEDLGETAAEIIVFDNVCTPDFSSSAYGSPNYKETCREVAYGICKGNISSSAKEYCPDDKLSSSDLLSLQDKCKKQVDKMTGKADDGDRNAGRACNYKQCTNKSGKSCECKNGASCVKGGGTTCNTSGDLNGCCVDFVGLDGLENEE